VISLRVVDLPEKQRREREREVVNNNNRVIKKRSRLFLTGSGRTDQSDVLPGFDRERDFSQDRGNLGLHPGLAGLSSESLLLLLRGRVAERHVAELDGTRSSARRNFVQRNGGRRVFDRRLFSFEDFPDVSHVDQCLSEFLI
jgi:hypothetical protein